MGNNDEQRGGVYERAQASRQEQHGSEVFSKSKKIGEAICP
jgi:hypothetical protein